MILLSNSLAIMALLGFASAVPELKKRACPATTRQVKPVMASGYTATVVAKGLKTPREMVFDPLGNMLVVNQGGGGVSRITWTDNGGLDVCSASITQIINDATLNHGLEITQDGKTIFVSSVASVFAYDYDPATGKVGTKKAVITGMNIPGPYHLTRTLRIPKSHPDILFVQRGSDGNIDTTAVQASSGKSQLRIFNISSILTTPVAYASSGTLLGMELRNSVGWAQHPITNHIWSVENSADDIKKGGKDVHTNNPAEELNFHGLFNDSTNPLIGANYGYPACFSTWDATTLGNTVGVQTTIDASVGNPTDADCLKRTAPKLVFPAHTAPVDIKFKKDGSEAFITFHGSWDRNPPDGYRLSVVQFKDGMPVEPSTSQTAAVNIMYNANNAACPNSCFRPAGLAWDSKDRLYMSSDSTGEIFIIGGTS